jgi:hypothetical protein
MELLFGLLVISHRAKPALAEPRLKLLEKAGVVYRTHAGPINFHIQRKNPRFSLN